jgi:NAD(P)H-nitrite reductase large subunit
MCSSESDPQSGDDVLTRRYDILVLATGSAAGLPPYVSTERARDTKGVFVYRSIADLENIIKYAEQSHVTRAEVIGGGVSLGLDLVLTLVTRTRSC